MELDRPFTTLRSFLDHWDGVRMVTDQLLGCFSDKELRFRLVPEWRTAGELFYHIGAHQYFVCRGVLTGRWRPLPWEPDADWTGHQEAASSSVQALRRWLTEVQGKTREWAAQADDHCLEALRPDNPWHEGIRGWLLLHHAYQDELHHRGQLYAVARHLGKVPPQVFAEEYPSYWDARKGK